MKLEISRLNSESDDFWGELEKLLAWEAVADEAVISVTREILQAVRTDGDRS